MKLLFKNLQELIREALREDGDSFWGTEQELDRSVSAMDPDTVADHDYVDSDTGEVVLSRGELARKCRFHPQYLLDRQEKAKERQARLDAEEAQWELEDAEYEREEEEHKRQARIDLDAAVAKFAESCKDYMIDNPDVDPSDIVSDIAESFFFQNPDWVSWAGLLGMSRRSIKSYVADMAYEAMMRN